MDIWKTIELLKELHEDNEDILDGIEEIENQLEYKRSSC